MSNQEKDANDTAVAAIAEGHDPSEALRERIAKRENAIEVVRVVPEPASDAKRQRLCLPNAAYHGVIGTLARTIQPHTESDPGAVLLQLLVVVGAIAGRRRYYAVEATRHFPNLFVVLVGDTSKGRKGTSWGWTRHVADGLDAKFSACKIVSGLSSGEGLIYHVRDARKEMQNIAKKHEPARFGEVLVDTGVDDKRLLVIESEYATVLRQIERNGNTLSPVVRDAWDGVRLGTLTKNSPLCATNPHIAIIGHVTASELRRRLSETEYANGFANRFLIVSVRRSRELPFGGSLRLEELAGSISELANRLRKHQGCVHMDLAAHALWAAKYHELSRARPGLSGALTARSEAQAIRLALTYAVADGAECIGFLHLKAALAIVEWSIESVHHVFGDLLGDAVADAILTALRDSPNGLSRSEILDVFSRHKTASEIGAGLQTLAEAGVAQCEKIATGGAPKEIWMLREKRV